MILCFCACDRLHYVFRVARVEYFCKPSKKQKKGHMNSNNTAIANLGETHNRHLTEATETLQKSLSPSMTDEIHPICETRTIGSLMIIPKDADRNLTLKITRKDVFAILGLGAAYAKAAPELKSIAWMLISLLKKWLG